MGSGLSNRHAGRIARERVFLAALIFRPIQPKSYTAGNPVYLRMAMAKIPHLLVHNRGDNVGVVVVENLAAGTDMFCVVTEDNSEFHAVINQDVPIGHKVALQDLPVGETVIKYGQDIGRIVAPVHKGDHVHTHNLKTKRW
jgi:(2R)-sulfolactate sulfo-lyase subunit alpha